MATKLPPTLVSAERLRALPTAPGVYLMRDAEGEVLYVGKAKNLRARVRSYFNGSDERYNVEYILERVHSIDTLVTEGERQALVLEADLIRKYKPQYNIRLKDDRAHLVVRIDMTDEWPRLELVRAVRDDQARYVGPFAFSGELRTVLEVIRRVAPLRTCSDRVLHNRVRPCLEFQIKRCCGPCCLTVDRAQYLDWIEQSVRMLEGHTEEVVTELEASMERASAELRFEDAAQIRDRISILKRMQEEKHSSDWGPETLDAFGLYREGTRVELSVVLVRQGRLFESRTFGFSDVHVSNEELISSLLTQFYEGDSNFPDSILLPAVLEDARVRSNWFSERRGKKVFFVTPQRGTKFRLLELAQTNAKQNFEARFSDLDRQSSILQALQVELGLEEIPRTIECVDISHFQGGSTVGAVVAFQDMKPEKSRYRSFHLSQEINDDFASMREVVGRHLSRAAEENTLSDLMIIDGGPPQLAQARAVRRELGLTRPAMIGLAKKRSETLHYRAPEPGPGSVAKPRRGQKPERVYVEAAELPVVLNTRSEALHLLERIRNEAHRFAITFHRKTRAKKLFRSELDAIPGIGDKRRKDLLKEFGSVKAIRAADAEEISLRCKIPFPIAERIAERLKKKPDLDSE